MIEMNLKKQKWLMVAIYCPPSQPQQCFFGEIDKMLDHYCHQYESLILIGDFNCVDGDVIRSFVDNFNLCNLVRRSTCFKADNPRSIDLMLANRNKCFPSISTMETSLSDFHFMIITTLKGGYMTRAPK